MLRFTLEFAVATFVTANVFAQELNCNAPARPKVNWSKCPKDGIKLREANLREAVLTDISLRGSDLIVSNLTNAKMERAKLEGVILPRTRLFEVNFTQAKR